MMDALVSARDGIVDTGDRAGAFKALPPVGQVAGTLGRWEPWVRAYVILQDLLAPLRFEPVLAGQPATAAGLKLRHLGAGAAAVDVVSITRPSEDAFAAQIAQVLDWAELRTERQFEILAQVDPQYAFWSQVVSMRPDRSRSTFELINLVLQFCVYVEMKFKHELGVWRPVDLSPQVQPVITTPGHGAFPMGHATQAYAVARVLSSLRGLASGSATDIQLQRQAARISINRVIAGVHFTVDATAGRVLGEAIGHYLMVRAGDAAASWGSFSCEGHRMSGLETFDPSAILARHDQGEQAIGTIGTSGLFKAIWDKARQEAEDEL